MSPLSTELVLANRTLDKARALVERHRAVAGATLLRASTLDGCGRDFDVVINDFQRPRTNAQPWRVRVADETGFLTLAFFPLDR